MVSITGFSTGFTSEQAQGLVRVLLGVAVYTSEQALSGHVSHSTIVCYVSDCTNTV